MTPAGEDPIRAGNAGRQSSSSLSISAVDVHLPLSGKSRWVDMMRLLAAGIVFLLLFVLPFMLLLGGGERGTDETQRFLLIFAGVCAVLVFEYFVFLKIVIPKQADYARYDIHADRVVYYPLSLFALSEQRRPEAVPIEAFLGLVVAPEKGFHTKKPNKRLYAVYLLHATKPARTIRVHSSPVRDGAESYAKKLAQKTGLNVAVRESFHPARPQAIPPKTDQEKA